MALSPIDAVLQASRAGLPLLIVHPVGGRRLMAEVFAMPDGIAFVDVGWSDPWQSGHPFHVVAGELVQELPNLWRLGGQGPDGADVYVVDDWDETTMADWRRWTEWRDGEGKKTLPTRARALALIRADIAPQARDLDEPDEDEAEDELRAARVAYEAAFGGLPWRLLTRIPPAELAAGLREFVARGHRPTIADLGRRFGFNPPDDGDVW
jgi:hypothetical protein